MEGITKYTFFSELRKMAASCTGNKPSTAIAKATKLYNKYQGIIEYSESNVDYYRIRYEDQRRLIDVIKSGVVTWSLVGGGSGKMLIKDLEQIDIDTNGNTTLTTKNGRVQKFGKGYEYLQGLL
jgi:hypothetical protein